MAPPGQSKGGGERVATEASGRRFREIHYHRFPLGVRSNLHGTCLLRSHLPVRLPRPHTMQLIYRHPPPGVGYRRGTPPTDAAAARDPAALEHWQGVLREIDDERRRVAEWLTSQRAIARTHVVVATQSGLQFFVAGFGYWNVVDIDLGLHSEACVGVKAFEVCGGPSLQHSKDGQDQPAEEQHQVPALIIALTTYVKQPIEAQTGATEETGTYRLYALGHTALPPLPQEFVAKHALSNQPVAVSTPPAARPDTPSPSPSPPGASPELPTGGAAAEAAADPAQSLPINSYAYLEERLFGLNVGHDTLCLELAYLPFRISQDVGEGEPLVLLVAGNDNKVHRYALGSDRIVEIEPLPCPKAVTKLTYTVFDARVIGPYHVQLIGHQDYTMTLQASRALTRDEAAEHASSGAGAEGAAHLRRLLVADQEVYDASPILATIFTPDTPWIDRTAFDYVIANRCVAGTPAGPPLAAGDVYQPQWPIGTMGMFPRPGAGADAADQLPRVHALLGFVGQDAIVYHDVPVAGLDPVPTLVGGIAGQVPASAPHVVSRLGGRGGVFALPGSSRENLLTSVHFSDLDFDGTKEIIMGTASGAVIIYKAVPGKGYVLVWKRRFPAPVYGIFSTDINCDGANELVVVTLLGVHVLQPNLAHVRAKLLRRLAQVADCAQSEAATQPAQ